MKPNKRVDRPRLRAERKKNNWTQEYVAAEIGITVRAYHYYEHGGRTPSLDIANKLEDLFGIPQRELLVLVDCTLKERKTEDSASSTA